MRKLLIIDKDQFGYHISPYKYALYLSRKFDVTYVCWDEKRDKNPHGNVNVIYLQKKGNILNRFLILMRNLNDQIKVSNFDCIFLVYFFGCSLLKIFNYREKFNLDIKTVSVTSTPFINWVKDGLLKIESSFFKNITVLNYRTGKKLGLKSFHILPLGSEIFAENFIDTGYFDYLYVGTLSNRNIMDVVHGFKIYIDSLKRNNNHSLLPRLILVGVGYGNELESIRQYASENQLEEKILARGFVPYDQLHSYFQKSKVGISYVPITDQYTDQPPTKTYEYLLSGLPVIGTATNANKELICSDNGILIEDNSKDISIAMEKMFSNYLAFDRKKIQENSRHFSWEIIIYENLLPYLNSL